MEIILVIIFIAAMGFVLVFTIYFGMKDRLAVNNTVKETGVTIERPKHFLRQHHIFTTSTDIYNDIYSVIDKEMLSRVSIACGVTSDKTKYKFTCTTFKSGFISYLNRLKDQNDGKYRYVYYIDHMDNPGNIIVEKTGNILLTEIEKAFVKLDESTEIKRELGDYKTKTKLF